MRIHYLQHVPFENPGIILTWAKKMNYTVTGTLLYLEEKPPVQEEYDWLVIMGGPMNIYEEDKYPWLGMEKRFIRSAIDCGKVVMGLCLGGQLIADALGGKVIRNEFREIGWFPVELTEEALSLPQFSFLPGKPVVFEWHGDTFTELPESVTVIATNEACKNQAFLCGTRVYGFQFHMESTREIIEALILNCGGEMIPGPFIQSEEDILSNKDILKQNNEWMERMLSNLAVMYEKGEI